MEWCRLYANLDDDVRVQRAEHAAPGCAWLLIQSFMYCTRAESQGFVPPTQLPRFGVSYSDVRVKALVSEGLWLVESDGHLLDPDIWTEDRNLSNSAERKKEADRERMRAKRAAERGEAYLPHVSRDSSATVRATGSATGSRDSRTHKREEKSITPLTPRTAGGTGSRCKRHQRPRAGCADCALPPLAPVPDWCGECTERTRRLEGPDGEDRGPCPNCHPSTVRQP